MFDETASVEEYDAVSRHPDIWHPRRGLQLVLESVMTKLRAAMSASRGSMSRAAPSSLDTRSVSRRASSRRCTASRRRRFILRRRSSDPITHNPLMRRASTVRAGLDGSSEASGGPSIASCSIQVAPGLNEWRRELGLPPVTRVFRDWIHSPQRVIGLFPDWFGVPQSDWPASLRLTGFPLFDDSDHRAGAFA